MEERTMNYYEQQLSRIRPSVDCPAQVKISGPYTGKTFNVPTGVQTNWMNLNAESAKALIAWLQANFPAETLPEYKRVKNDVNGNPRYVFHFGDFIGPADDHVNNWSEDAFKLALSRARRWGGKAYRGKDFGGGIVFQSYNIQELQREIKELQK